MIRTYAKTISGEYTELKYNDSIFDYSKWLEE